MDGLGGCGRLCSPALLSLLRYWERVGGLRLGEASPQGLDIQGHRQKKHGLPGSLSGAFYVKIVGKL